MQLATTHTDTDTHTLYTRRLAATTAGPEVILILQFTLQVSAEQLKHLTGEELMSTLEQMRLPGMGGMAQGQWQGGNVDATASR